jgi:hypothetical protein
MASADMSRRVWAAVPYPPLSEMSDEQRREFYEALLDATPSRICREVAGGGPPSRGESAEAAAGEGVGVRAPRRFGNPVPRRRSA